MRIGKFTYNCLGFMVVVALAGMPALTAHAAAEEIARPSNPGGPGPAATMNGNPKAGARIFAQNCMPCHVAAGKGGVPNPGSSDGTVPPLNPIDPTIASTNPKIFAYNVDLFIQHGSTPEGKHPAISMPAWGDDNMLSQQKITDIIAYVIGLNTSK